MNTALILVFAYAFNEEGDVESKQYSKNQKVVLMKSSIYPCRIKLQRFYYSSARELWQSKHILCTE